jgi:hypothetical protein
VGLAALLPKSSPTEKGYHASGAHHTHVERQLQQPRQIGQGSWPQLCRNGLRSQRRVTNSNVSVVPPIQVVDSVSQGDVFERQESGCKAELSWVRRLYCAYTIATHIGLLTRHKDDGSHGDFSVTHGNTRRTIRCVSTDEEARPQDSHCRFISQHRERSTGTAPNSEQRFTLQANRAIPNSIVRWNIQSARHTKRNSTSIGKRNIRSLPRHCGVCRHRCRGTTMSYACIPSNQCDDGAEGY